VTWNANECPAEPEETGEEYCMGRLSPEDAQAFEDHCIACPQCARIAMETERFIRAMKGYVRQRGECSA
jgi:hypothetical protein